MQPWVYTAVMLSHIGNSEVEIEYLRCKSCILKRQKQSRLQKRRPRDVDSANFINFSGSFFFLLGGGCYFFKH